MSNPKFKVGDHVKFLPKFAKKHLLLDWVGFVLSVDMGRREEEYEVEWRLIPPSNILSNMITLRYAGKDLTKYRGEGYQLRLQLNGGGLHHE